ncbi:MAG: Leucine--tRNA ligase [Methanonatronarchaeales archaeon]|nr:Leucine--tRNA ligase [Methanonatronarchaeales archaeon]
MSYDFGEVEERWRNRWEDEGVFEADPSDRDKFYITVAYPYPSGAMHIGHVRTFTLPDVFARFRRMQGYNVLFPMAWHVTGTPIIGALNRLKEGEEEQLRVLRDVFGVPEEELEAMEEPMDYASYFIENSYRSGMRRLGFSVDWRREFTTADGHYRRFIEWQYRRLREEGHLSRGLHPTKYCLGEENPVTTHDLLEGEDADIQNYTLVKFTDSESRVLPMATLRPETVYGVTNAFVDPDSSYVEASVEGGTWVVSEEAVEKLEHQGHDLGVERGLPGRELVGLSVENPVTGDDVSVLPASFVDTGSATGVVMSVPAHAPFDHVAVEELKRRAEELREEYGIDPEEVRSIEPVALIDVEGMGEFPAVEVVEDMGIESQDDPGMEEATRTVYNREFHDGVLKEVAGGFAGRRVSTAKDALREHFSDEGVFDEVYEFSRDVVCRCGSRVIVAEAETWFLEYGDPEWKEETMNLLDGVETVPEGTREDYVHTVDWLDSWPCIRNFGLGTRLPFDDRFIIEPLSDSTIYMAFYTLAHELSEEDAGELSDGFFDHVLLGEGTAEDVAGETGMEAERVEALRESFSYWYPLDWRTSAHDLVQNHLTFFMFHHAALFPEEDWPRGIATWGMGLLEGEKMSSSKGNVVLAGEAVERYGADTARFFLFNNAEPWQDFDWRAEQVERTQRTLRSFHERCSEEIRSPRDEGAADDVDAWMLSRLEQRLAAGTEALEGFQTRKALQELFYGLNADVKWYRKRKRSDTEGVMGRVRRRQVKALAPFIPHMAEELWSVVSDDLLCTSGWPEPDGEAVDPQLDAAEDLVRRTLDDVREILNVTGKEPEEVVIYTAADWKREVLEAALDEDVSGLGELLPLLMESEEMRERGGEVKKVSQSVLDNARGLDNAYAYPSLDERGVLERAESFLEGELSCNVRVEREEDGGEGASKAIPIRPGIVVR